MKIGLVLAYGCGTAVLYLFTYMMLDLHNPFSTIDIFNHSLNDIYSHEKIKKHARLFNNDYMLLRAIVVNFN